MEMQADVRMFGNDHVPVGCTDRYASSAYEATPAADYAALHNHPINKIRHKVR